MSAESLRASLQKRKATADANFHERIKVPELQPEFAASAAIREQLKDERLRTMLNNIRANVRDLTTSDTDYKILPAKPLVRGDIKLPA